MNYCDETRQSIGSTARGKREEAGRKLANKKAAALRRMAKGKKTIDATDNNTKVFGKRMTAEHEDEERTILNA